MRELVIASSSEEASSVGRALGTALLLKSAGELVITLQGELGAGKTTLVRGVLEVFGVAGAVRSPTYTLVEPYEFPKLNPPRTLYHLDLYRVTALRDLEGLGLRDMLQPGSVVLIEWPENAGEALPPVDLHIQLSYMTEGRRITLESGSRRGEGLLTQMLAGQRVSG